MKILALQIKRIGDLVLTTPALAALKELRPDAEITLLAPAAAAGLLPAMPFVDRHFVLRKSLADARLWARLAAARFDVCLDFTGNDRSAWATLLSRAPLRATFAWVRGKRGRARAYNRFIESSVRERHTVDHYLDLLQVLELAPGERPVTLTLPAPTEAHVARMLAAQGIEGPFAVSHPGTAREEKYGLPEHWATVIRHLEARGLQCLLTGGSDAFERRHLDAIQTGLPSPVPDFAGALDLLSFAAVVKRARIFLSVDSGPMHIASAFQRPQIALFGPTNPFHWRPRHADALVVMAGAPEAMSAFTPRHRAAAVAEISTEQVIRATNSLLDPSGS